MTIIPSATIFNERFKIVRKHLNLTQIEMADALEVTQGTISEIERNNIGVTDKIRNKLFSKLDINQDWFYSGKGNIKNISKTNNEFELSPIPAMNHDLNEAANFYMREGRGRKEKLLKDLENENEQYIKLYDTLQYLEKNVNMLAPITKDYLHLYDPENILDLIIKSKDSTISVLGIDPGYELRIKSLIKSLVPLSSQIESVNKSIEKFLQDLKKEIGIDNKYYL